MLERIRANCVSVVRDEAIHVVLLGHRLLTAKTDRLGILLENQCQAAPAASVPAQAETKEKPALCVRFICCSTEAM
jgi:hypothetical protein